MVENLGSYKDEEVEYGSILKTPEWNQESLDKALENYYSELSVKDLMFEKLWLLLRSEIHKNLKIRLKDEISLDDAEFIALKELRRRLEKGSIKYLSKTYVSYIAKTAIQYVNNRRRRFVSIDMEKNSELFFQSRNSPPDQKRFIKYADLYICLEKLPRKELELVKLHHFSDFKLEDVATELGIEHDTARKRHNRIIAELRKCLETQKSIN